MSEQESLLAIFTAHEIILRNLSVFRVTNIKEAFHKHKSTIYLVYCQSYGFVWRNNIFNIFRHAYEGGVRWCAI
jgi:hypothetical protein